MMQSGSQFRRDTVVVDANVASVAPTLEELSRLARTVRGTDKPLRAERTDRLAPEVRLEPKIEPLQMPPAELVDAPVLDRVSTGSRLRTSLMGFSLALIVGVGGALWQTYGSDAKLMLSEWTSARSGSTAATADNSDLRGSSQGNASGGATSISAANDRALADDVAGMRQEIEQLKARIEQLRGEQDQAARDLAAARTSLQPEVAAARAAMPVARPKPPAQSADARARRSQSPAPTSTSVATRPSALQAPTQLAQPIMPVREAASLPSDPPESLREPDGASIPRPPLPVR